MGTSAEIVLRVKDGTQFVIRTAVDGYFFGCGRDLWEYFGSLTSDQWDTLNEQLETMTWVHEHHIACDFGIYYTASEPIDCSKEPSRYTVIDVLRKEYYNPTEVLRSAMDGKLQHMINFISEDCPDYEYKIDFISKEFFVYNGEEYVNMPFTCKIAQLLFGIR